MLDSSVVIIGSGPAGVQAADELTARGITVLMLDGGYSAETQEVAPTENFEDVRRSRSDQAMWFLGKDLSGIPVSGLTGGLGGGQVSGNRAYTIRNAEALLPIKTENCQVIQSLAEGGLGAAWGAACAIPEEAELHAMGLDPKALEPHLDAVIEGIGISGPSIRKGIQPPLPLDLHGSLMQQSFEKRRTWFAREKLTVMQPLSAILTKDVGERKASTLADMEYWSDPNRSVYRPQYTLEELRKKNTFTYVGGLVVESISSEKDGISVIAKTITGREQKTFRGKKVILAAGAIGSARIALQSMKEPHDPLPFVAKPHVFTACLHAVTLGKKGPKERTSLCQMLLIDEEKRATGLRSGLAQLYSYRSLMLFRLLTSQPLPSPEGMKLLAMLTPALVIADIRFPGLPEHGSLSLKDGFVHVRCNVPKEEQAQRQLSWKRMRKGLRSLGLLPVKNMRLPEASTSHYGGTLPYAKEGGSFTTDANGALRGLEHVFVADAAVFKTLPIVPHTLTMMANARRIATHVASVL